MERSDYSRTSRFLHRLALDYSLITQATFDIEHIFNTYETDSTDAHVFVSGLARSGTTIILKTLYSTGEFYSQTYRDMPFVLMPNLWKKLSEPFYTDGDLKERAHGDGINFNYDSPESFEEVFWRSFCGKDYIMNNSLMPHSVNSETLKNFRLFVGSVLHSSQSTKMRYLSKNNNNVLRLMSLSNAFPDAKILIPFRNPIHQSFSLLTQHQRFSEQQKKDPFIRNYMSWLGHHEFGLNHKPFLFNTSEITLSTDTLDYWLTIWSDTYEYILSNLTSNSFLICYENLCDRSDESIRRLYKLLNINSSIDNSSNMLKSSNNQNISESYSTHLSNHALSIYNSLLLKSYI